MEEPEFREEGDELVIDGENNRVLVAPNPARDYTAVYTVKPLQSDGVFELFDLSGKLVAVHTLVQGNSLFSISLSELPCGFYSYRIVGANQNPVSGKLVISK